MNHTQKEKFTNDLCGVALMLIFIGILHGVVYSAYNDFNYNYSIVTMWTYIGGGILLAGAIALLIYAYLKKSGSKAAYGGELMVMAFSLAILPGCYLYFPKPFTQLRFVFPILFIVYYIGKAVYVIYHRNDVVSSKNKKSK